MCFEMKNVRLFLKGFEKIFKPSIRICFFNEPIWSKFSFFFSWAFIFSKLLDGIEEKAHKHKK